MTNYKHCPKPSDVTTTGSPTNQPNDLMANSCVNKHHKCNYISDPFYESELKGKHKEKVKQNFNEMCGLRNGEIRKCCSLTNSIESDNQNIKDVLKHGFKVKNYMGDDTREENCQLDKSCVYYACKKSDKDCKKIDNCKKGDKKCNLENNYYKCKFNNITPEDIDRETKVISNLEPSCYSGICKNEEYSGWVLSSEEKNEKLKRDKGVLLSIKEDNLDVFKNLVNEKDYIHGLSVGYPGNTLLHETIYYNSPKIFKFILKEKGNQNDYLEKKNKDGNTPLNLACLKSNLDFYKLLLKHNANLFTHNEYLETPLDSALRNNQKNYSLLTDILDESNNMLLFNKNIESRNPVHTAVLEKDKDLRIIRLLVNRGGDVLDIDKHGNTILVNLKKQKNTPLNMEIETLLIKTLYDFNKHNKQKYAFILAQHNEYSPFVFTEGAKDDKEINFYNPDVLNNLEIEYTQDLDSSNLLQKKNPAKIKVFPEKYRNNKIIEGFDDNNNNTTTNISRNNILEYGILLIVLIVLFYFIL